MSTFEIIVHEQQKLVKATLAGDTIRVESGALHYWRGQIEMTSGAPDASGFLRSAMTGENIFRPTYTGYGEVYVGPPYFGEFIILECTADHPGWILDRGAYLCSSEGVEVSMHRNSAKNALLGTEGLFQTKVQGQGQVVLRAPGTVQSVKLTGETLAVDGKFAVAREASLDYQVKRATKSLMGSMTSGEGLLQYIQGNGTVLLSPVPDLQQSMIDKITAPMTVTPTAGASSSASPLVTMMVIAIFAVVMCGGFMTMILATLVGG